MSKRKKGLSSEDAGKTVDFSGAISQICEEKGISFVGKIPFDKAAVSLVNNGLTLVDKEGLSKQAIVDINGNIMNLLYGEEKI